MWRALACLGLCAAAPAQEGTASRASLARGSETIELIRDAYGVPTIRATTFEGLWHGQGYATAEDRFWQMDRLRRDARGQWAEIGLWRLEPALSPEAAVRHDQEARRDRYSEAERRRMLEFLPSEVRVVLEAYAEGVNAWLETASREQRLPAAYARLGVSARPWSPTDSLALAELMTDLLGGGSAATLEAWRLRRELKQDLNLDPARGDALLNELLHLYDPTAVPTEPRDEVSRLPSWSPPVDQEGVNGLDDDDIDPAMLRAEIDRWNRFLSQGSAGGGRMAWDGQAWAVDGRRSPTGAPMLWAAPVVGGFEPPLLHEAHLTGPAAMQGGRRLNARGVTVPGLPALLAGFNESAAWSIHRGNGQVQDYYLEVFEIDPPWSRYAYRGAWVEPLRRDETILVWRDGEAPEALVETVGRTVHGPLVQFGTRRLERFGRPVAVALALRRVWWEDWSYSLVLPMLDLTRASDYDDFFDATVLLRSSHHCFYADSAGTIAYQWAGRYPFYGPDHDPRFPSRGFGDHDWAGFIRFEGQPRSRRPTEGLLVNWGHKPGESWPGLGGGLFSDSELMARFGQSLPLDTGDIPTFDQAVPADPLDLLLLPMLARIERHPLFEAEPVARRALDRMRQAPQDAGDLALRRELLSACFRQFLTRCFPDKFPETLAPDAANLPFLIRTFGGLLVRSLGLLGSVSTQISPFQGRSPDDLLAEAVVDLSRERAGLQGPDPARWRPIGKVTSAEAGAGFVVAGRERPGFAFAVELTRPPQGRLRLAPGQAEDPRSPHAQDQRSLLERLEWRPVSLEASAN